MSNLADSSLLQMGFSSSTEETCVADKPSELTDSRAVATSASGRPGGSPIVSPGVVFGNKIA